MKSYIQQVISTVKEGVGKFLREEDGATAIEYGLLAGLIAAAIVVIVGNLGTGIQTMFQTLCNKLGFTTCTIA